MIVFDDANIRARFASNYAGNVNAGRLVILNTMRRVGDNLNAACGDARSIPLQKALRSAELPLDRPTVINVYDASGVP